MKYARHFIVTLLVFLAILVGVMFLNNQPFTGYSKTTNYYSKPVTVDTCNQTIARSWTGTYESQGCFTAINHDWNYYYGSAINNLSGTYVPYMK
jgi:hypothetical protein